MVNLHLIKLLYLLRLSSVNQVEHCAVFIFQQTELQQTGNREETVASLSYLSTSAVVTLFHWVIGGYRDQLRLIN